MGKAKQNVEPLIDKKKLTEMVEKTKKTDDIKKVVKEEEQKINFWNRGRFRKEVEDGMYREIRSIRLAIKDLEPNSEEYTKAVQNLKIWTDAYTCLTKNKTDMWKTGLTVAASIAGTLLVCGHESRGEAFVGKGLSTIIKPKNQQ